MIEVLSLLCVLFLCFNIFSSFAVLFNKIGLWCVVGNDKEDIKEKNRIKNNIEFSIQCLIASVTATIITSILVYLLKQ